MKRFECHKCGENKFYIQPKKYTEADLEEFEDDPEELLGQEFGEISCANCGRSIIAIPWDSKQINLATEKEFIKQELKEL